MLKSLQAIIDYRTDNKEVQDRPQWLQYLISAEERVVNIERIHSLQELAQANHILDYVERSLRLLDRMKLSFWMKEVLEEVLCWAEVAKGGTVRDRIAWQRRGINYNVHNHGSAALFLEHAEDPQGARTLVVHRLIEGHGLIGQQIRGEVPFSESIVLSDLVAERWMTSVELESLLLALNQCVIGAVDENLWLAVQSEVEERSRYISSHTTFSNEPTKERIRRLRAASIRRGEDFDAAYDTLARTYALEEQIEPIQSVTLWYVEAAMQHFSLEQFLKMITLTVQQKMQGDTLNHISFEKLMNTMYYDYKGSKKINVYKQRIIEKYLGELTWDAIESGTMTDHNPHLTHLVEQMNPIPDTVFFEFKFSPAAEKLIEFCVEAEKSSLYDRAVLMLFDLFELRRDAYDRFHNEEEYLADMNQTADYKKVILDYIVGTSVLDIGPGGGVLLDLIEERMPQVTPIGIDISTNVVEALNRKKQLEGRRWDVMQGDALNLKDDIPVGSVDTVIFSSIIHELYSYIPFQGRKFNFDTIGAALKSAFDVLAHGGRIIIRDGIMTHPKDQCRRVRFLQQDGMMWLERYCKDFAGRQIEMERVSDNEVMMPVNDAMEFLYTYTWGEEAYIHEVQEQFGYFTLPDYLAFIHATLGTEAHIVTSRAYLQAGYTEALQDKVVITDEAGREVPLPDSTCFIVIEKR
ncbi:class I SAM-dependent methyltransferase [Paenibacillus guangzhouensis]|uniref:class I SAM-dependent methyltransferase n=1 Tax=Paenibacillus guangzhouensis TaxID=1473112 RepID=UPI0012668F3A|nr:class I SAM-dependent methyltransferase [Paenibacillus guangzhouensis]